MKYEYIAICENYLHSFNDELSLCVKQGWEPFGSLIITKDTKFAILLRREIKQSTES